MNDIDTEKRFSGIEGRLEVIDTKLDGISEHYVAKSDLKDVQLNIADKFVVTNRWIFATGLSLAALIVALNQV